MIRKIYQMKLQLVFFYFFKAEKNNFSDIWSDFILFKFYLFLLRNTTLIFF